MNREPFKKLENGLQIYKVLLVGGTFDGTFALCSHNTVYKGQERYIRGPDGRYYYTPEGDGEPCNN